MLRRWKPWEGSRSPIMLLQLKVCLWDWELPRTVSKPRLMLGTTGLFRPSEARSQPLCSLVASPVIQLLHVAFPTYCILVIDFWFKWVDFPGGSDGEASAYSAGDPVSVSGSGRSPGEGSGPHSSVLAWKIPRAERSGGLQSISVSGESSWPRRRAPASCLSCTGSLILCHQHHLGSPGPN